MNRLEIAQVTFAIVGVPLFVCLGGEVGRYYLRDYKKSKRIPPEDAQLQVEAIVPVPSQGQASL